MDLKFLDNVPLSQNPLSVAFKQAFSSSSNSEEHPSFLGKYISPSAPDQQREKYYSPVSQYASLYYQGVTSDSTSSEDEQQNNNTTNNSNSTSGSRTPNSLSSIFNNWSQLPEYDSVCSSSSTTKSNNNNNNNKTTTREEALQDVRKACERIFDEFLSIQDSPQKISTATGDAIDRKIIVSFNGGKDCMVILHLVCSMIPLSFIQKYFIFFVHEPCEEKIECCEAVLFRDWVMKTVLKVDFRVCKGKQLKDHLQDLVDEYSVNLALIGTRKTDPSGRWQAGCIAPTTKEWPNVMLVSPIFRWSFGLIWEYTLNVDVPRCSLYDKGFTSLGEKRLTTPNACLAISCSSSTTGDNNNGEERKTFEPAWRLLDFTQERENRVGRGCATSSSSTASNGSAAATTSKV